MPDTHSPDPSSPYTTAITAIDAFIRILRHHRSTLQLLASLDQFSALQIVIAAAARSLADDQLPPEPLRSNYRARLETLAFELRRVEPLLQQEHSRLSRNLHHFTTSRAWLETLSATQQLQ